MLIGGRETGDHEYRFYDFREIIHMCYGNELGL